MRTIILLVFVTFAVFSYGKTDIHMKKDVFPWSDTFYLVQSRSLKNADDVLKQFQEYFLRSPDEFDLFKFRQSSMINRQKSKSNDDSSETNDDEIDQEKFVDPRLFKWNRFNTDSHNRPASSYGRKSHWDTYFGRK